MARPKSASAWSLSVAVEVENGVVGIELDRPVEIGERWVWFADILIDQTTIGVDWREARVELDGAIEICKRSLNTASEAKGHAAVGIRNSLLTLIELAALDQIGTGQIAQ